MFKVNEWIKTSDFQLVQYQGFRLYWVFDVIQVENPKYCINSVVIDLDEYSQDQENRYILDNYKMSRQTFLNTFEAKSDLYLAIAIAQSDLDLYDDLFDSIEDAWDHIVNVRAEGYCEQMISSRLDNERRN